LISSSYYWNKALHLEDVVFLVRFIGESGIFTNKLSSKLIEALSLLDFLFAGDLINFGYLFINGYSGLVVGFGGIFFPRCAIFFI
jgi:hypothetical protein